MIGFLSFLSRINYTTLPCIVCSLLFHSCVAEWSFVGDTYGSCLLAQANISRLGLCLVRIATLVLMMIVQKLYF